MHVGPKRPLQVAEHCPDQLLILPGLLGVRYYSITLRYGLIIHHCRDAKSDRVFTPVATFGVLCQKVGSQVSLVAKVYCLFCRSLDYVQYLIFLTF